MHILAYIPVTKDPDAFSRSARALYHAAGQHGVTITYLYREESPDAAGRPALFLLLAATEPGYGLLVESLDVLAPLEEADWQRLQRELAEKQVRVIALDVPALWPPQADNPVDAIALLAERRQRDLRKAQQAAGIAKAKTSNPSKYRGRPENADRNAKIMRRLRDGQTWAKIMEETKASRATLAKLAKRIAAGESGPDAETQREEEALAAASGGKLTLTLKRPNRMR